MQIGDKVKNTTELAAINPIPVGTIGTIQQIDRMHDGTVALFGYEVAFEGFTQDTFPCKLEEIELVG